MSDDTKTTAPETPKAKAPRKKAKTIAAKSREAQVKPEALASEAEMLAKEPELAGPAKSPAGKTQEAIEAMEKREHAAWMAALELASRSSWVELLDGKSDEFKAEAERAWQRYRDATRTAS